MTMRESRGERARSGLDRSTESPGDDWAAAVDLHDSGRGDEAEEVLLRLLAVTPDRPAAWYLLARIRIARGDFQDALKPLREAVLWEPRLAEAYNDLGAVHYTLGQTEEAAANFRRAVGLKPDLADAHNNLALADLHQGKLPDAIAGYRRALAIKPDYADAHSNLLLALNYDESMSLAALFDAHAGWARDRAPKADALPFRRAKDRDPGRRLRVGYVSPDFRDHSVGYFLEPLLAAHDQGQFEITCYSQTARRDAVTARFETLAGRWRPLAALDDPAAAALIRRDQIDILVDLAGHTADNRLGIFARKPAPVQVTWLGYPNTTGLAAIDYRLSDGVADPQGEGDGFHAERLWRLPRSFLCYRPAAGAPLPGLLPAYATGRITFGSFNALAKITPATVRLWAALLRAVPGAGLKLKAKALNSPATAARCWERFAGEGIAPERVELAPWSPTRAEHLSQYHDVDIALDPIPYNGTATTCEAMWMGIPVLTLRGNRHAGRVGASLLAAVGLPELVADTAEDFVARGCALAADLDGLAALRGNLRARMAASQLCDDSHFARAVEEAYRAMWRRWCDRISGPAPA